jgi:hypothetical protein
VAHVYQWSPFVESTQGPACLGPNDNLLQNSSTTYSANNSALYHQVKLEFDQLNYNLLTDTLSYNFNPWVNVLIHGSNYVNAPNVYAYSVDDAVGNLQAEGAGFIIDVGSTKNLCTMAGSASRTMRPSAGQVRELLDIFTWAASFEGCVLRPTWVSYS